ncbi:hypothetical protein Tco_1165837, partial [Tanacetum coccineum]
PEYPEYLAPSDDEILIKDQPYAAEDGPTDYLTDGGDDDDDSSRDDANDEEEEEAFEEEEHLASTDSTVVSPAVDLVPSVEETDPFETDESAATPPPPPAYHTTPRMFEVGESLTTASARHPGLGDASPTDYGFVDMVDNAPRRHVPRAVGYGITDTWDELVDAIQEGALMNLKGVNTRVTKLVETHKRDTQDLYAHLEDAQDNRAYLSGRDNMLLEDRYFHHAAVYYELQAYRASTKIQDHHISSQETLTVTLVAQVSSLQSQLIATLG